MEIARSLKSCSDNPAGSGVVRVKPRGTQLLYKCLLTFIYPPIQQRQERARQHHVTSSRRHVPDISPLLASLRVDNSLGAPTRIYKLNKASTHLQEAARVWFVMGVTIVLFPNYTYSTISHQQRDESSISLLV